MIIYLFSGIFFFPTEDWLDYQLLLKGCNSRITRWKQCTGHDLETEHRASRPSLSLPFSQSPVCSPNQKLSLTLITTLWGRHNYYSYFSSWEHWRIEVSQLARSHSPASVRAGTWTHGAKLHVCSWPQCSAASHLWSCQGHPLWSQAYPLWMSVSSTSHGTLSLVHQFFSYL